MDANTNTRTERGISGVSVARGAIALILITGLLATIPATAAAAGPVPLQSDSASDTLCEETDLVGYLEGFMEVTTLLGLVGLVVVWQVDTLAEMFTMNPAQKRSLKQHKRSAAKAAVILLLVGPVFSLLVTTMGLPMQCFRIFGTF